MFAPCDLQLSGAKGDEVLAGDSTARTLDIVLHPDSSLVSSQLLIGVVKGSCLEPLRRKVRRESRLRRSLACPPEEVFQSYLVAREDFVSENDWE